MDRYQAEIRRVAAKSVKDLNLDTSSSSSSHRVLPRRLSNGSDGSSSAASSSSNSGGGANPLGGVNVALARREYLEKVSSGGVVAL